MPKTASRRKSPPKKLILNGVNGTVSQLSNSPRCAFVSEPTTRGMVLGIFTTTPNKVQSFVKAPATPHRIELRSDTEETQNGDESESNAPAPPQPKPRKR